jgi:mannose-6-phosphate isomerase-like protein (cupin superfamily)
MQKVNLAEKLAQFSDQRKPKIVGELNGQQVKLVKFQGPFVRHHHDQEDELFLVVKGRFRMEFRDRHAWLEEGEFLIVPRGVEHRPVADEEAHVLLFEPASTLNTGNVRNERTVAHLDRILRELATTLKQRCGTGGTVKDGRIEIQGDQRERIVAELEKLGYQVKRVGG